MGFLSDLVGIAAPIVGGAIGGPVGGAIGSAIGGAIAGGGSGGVKAAGQATEQNLAAIREAQGRIGEGAERSQQFLEPFAGVGQRGVDLSSFLGDPQQQFDFIKNNPLYNLQLENLNRQTNQSAASRGRLSAGDTLQQFGTNAMLASQPLIDRQRQDILNLLQLGSGTAGQQVGVESNASRAIADLMTGAGATQAAGTVAGQNAETARRGNIFDIGTQLAGTPGIQDFASNIFSGFTPPPQTGGFGNAPIGPLG